MVRKTSEDGSDGSDDGVADVGSCGFALLSVGRSVVYWWYSYLYVRRRTMARMSDAALRSDVTKTSYTWQSQVAALI